MKLLSSVLSLLAMLFLFSGKAHTQEIVHDAEYYILEAQNGEVWKVEDQELDQKLAELREKYGQPPNIVHFMWDDQPFGAVGIPAMQQIRGYRTPNLNQMAAEGMLFTRMYSEPSCTPTRAAAWSGQHPIRNGMYKVGFPIEYSGIAKDVVTVGEVMSEAGYATGFYGKAHLGDVAESWPHHQGFDESFTAIYNQVVSLWNPQAEAANAVVGLFEEALPRNPYKLDHTFSPKGYVFYIEGTKGGETREWCGIEVECYMQFDKEASKRALAFIAKNAKQKKPFFVEWWPLFTPFIPAPQKASLQRGLVGDAYTVNLDPTVGLLMKTLNDLDIAENTLVVAMSDNGPMTHNPPPGAGLGEGPFRGGKGDFLEGGVRVAAQAWWPGVIEPGQIADDIFHVTDLYTTFARLGGALKHIPTDRVIDGIDQTALLLIGDTHGRRDYVHIYAGPQLGATIKGQYKVHWISSDQSQARSGITSAFDLYNDHREVNPLVVNALHFKEPFRRMRARHEVWIRKYPHMPAASGLAYADIVNPRPETRALSNPPVDFKRLPFDPREVLDELEKLPYDPGGEPDYGR
ncbi:sulfatase-like hydrolase/transferase [Defluviimonas sp. D31]|uniref:sulfatase-like hydrolase/transferase n=1 Tax=Defluviimonas sp. D31 TaxID=3083253 RepID=UPI00296F9355|nr:sulfatase-like hydrolase/transferase [Defluviimonas sp. D31]MDW4551722.1 sulfatase-like hydrolase/transferase [Defluviimonas sp. D31]